jgi:uncharacterized protein (DUF924 family)
MTPADVIAFWREAGPKRWFSADPVFDRAVKDGFEQAHLLAARGALARWEDDAGSALALLLLTDQFSRNLYRGSAHAFATDPLARGVTGRAIARGFDRTTAPPLRQFFYLPFSHHEDTQSQDRAVALYRQMDAEGGDPELLRYAQLHAGLIARFGRFPHRNAVMGRISTEEETAYLAQGGFAG